MYMTLNSITNYKIKSIMTTEKNESTQPDPTTALARIIDNYGLELDVANLIRERFAPFFAQTAEWRERSKQLVVTQVTQTREMKMAREARLAIRDIRLEADKARKALKEDANRYNSTVQGIYNTIESEIKPIEEHLKLQEDFIQIQEQKRLDELRIEREAEMKPLSEFFPLVNNVELLSNEDYAKLIKGAELSRDAKIAQDRIDEENRLENERIRDLEKVRRDSVKDNWQHFPQDWKDECLGELTEDNWQKLVTLTNKAKTDYDNEQNRIRIENERLVEQKRLQTERYSKLFPVSEYGNPVDMMKLGEMSEKEFQTIF